MKTAARRRLVRSDGLPEGADYRDDGCEVNPSCLSCPLPKCRYDEPGGARAMHRQGRNPSIALASAQGESIDSLATRFNISRRTIFRVLRAQRETRG